MISVLFIAALPAYFRMLPWRCTDGAASVANGATMETLAECRPNKAGDIKVWVQRVADAMGHAGLSPHLRFGPLGPHLWGNDKGAIVSATFVKAADDFNVWISVQRMDVVEKPLPKLPAGVELVADHSQEDGQRLLSIQLPHEEAFDATMQSLGIQVLGRAITDNGKTGRIAWKKQTGHYTLKDNVLNVFVGAVRER